VFGAEERGRKRKGCGGRWGGILTVEEVGMMAWGEAAMHGAWPTSVVPLAAVGGEKAAGRGEIRRQGKASK